MIKWRICLLLQFRIQRGSLPLSCQNILVLSRRQKIWGRGRPRMSSMQSIKSRTLPLPVPIPKKRWYKRSSRLLSKSSTRWVRNLHGLTRTALTLNWSSRRVQRLLRPWRSWPWWTRTTPRKPRCSRSKWRLPSRGIKRRQDLWRKDKRSKTRCWFSSRKFKERPSSGKLKCLYNGSNIMRSKGKERWNSKSYSSNRSRSMKKKCANRENYWFKDERRPSNWGNRKKPNKSRGKKKKRKWRWNKR